jgi:hypothetical protein
MQVIQQSMFDVIGLEWYDMDANTSIAFNGNLLSEYEAIKCDGDYYLIPEGCTDLAQVATVDNLICEHEVLGTEGILEKYLNDIVVTEED